MRSYLHILEMYGGEKMVTAEVWLTPKKDVYIAEYYPKTNFAKKAHLFCNRFQGCGDIYRSLLKFDLCNLIPPNSTIKCASLYLPIFRNEIPCENTVFAFRLVEGWEENKVTWNNQPIFAPISVGSVQVESETFDTLCIDLSELVESWYDGFYNNFGILLSCDESIDSLLGFFSTRYHNSDYWPRLRISYFQNCCKEKKHCSYCD